MSWTNEPWYFLSDVSFSGRQIKYGYQHDNETAVTATGTDQAGAAPLVGGRFHYVDTPTNDFGVRLTSNISIGGMDIEIFNSYLTNTLKVYPATGHQLAALGADYSAANAALSVLPRTWLSLKSHGTTQWVQR